MNDAINDLLNVYAYWWASGAADPADRAREEESCRLAEVALGKQEVEHPMKPIGWNSECWNCGKHLGGMEDRPTYCPYCGQKLDWRTK